MTKSKPTGGKSQVSKGSPKKGIQKNSTMPKYQAPPPPPPKKK